MNEQPYEPGKQINAPPVTSGSQARRAIMNADAASMAMTLPLMVAAMSRRHPEERQERIANQIEQIQQRGRDFRKQEANSAPRDTQPDSRATRRREAKAAEKLKQMRARQA